MLVSSSSSLSIRHVESGVCVSTTEKDVLVTSCALERTDCADPNTTFLPSSRHESSACQHEQHPHEEPNIGRCYPRDREHHGTGSDDGGSSVCTGSPSACLGGDFVSNDEGCTLQFDQTKPSTTALLRATTTTTAPSLFGACHDGTTDDTLCYWSSDDCLSASDDEHTKTWLGVASPVCTCDNTLVGACVVDALSDYHPQQNNLYCAVSSHACDEQHSVFVNVQQLRDDFQTECRLCPTATEQGMAPQRPQRVLSDTNNNDDGGGGGSSATFIIVILAVVAGVFAPLIIGCLWARHRQRKREEEEEENEKEGEELERNTEKTSGIGVFDTVYIEGMATAGLKTEESTETKGNEEEEEEDDGAEELPKPNPGQEAAVP